MKNSKKEKTMIKFKEQDGVIFKMLDEPVPLTTDAEMPCLVRLIQDDTMLGKANKRSCHPDTIRHKIVCTELTDDGLFMQGNYSYRHEIIGYPVEEGSRWWALYQMMQGEKVFRVEWGCGMYCQYTNNEIITFRYGISSTINPVEEWIANAKRADFGWQIYTEPKPTLKVGDWVECVAKQGQTKLVDYLGGMGCYKTNYGAVISPCEILRKLSPSEVVVPITISGTVRTAYNEDGTIDDEQFQLLPNGSWDGTEMFISFDALDSHTRKLVESLLKAQEEEK